MKNRDDTPTDAPADQVLTVAVENDSEKKPESASTEKLESRSMSYRRSRIVALMKLAIPGPEDNKAA